MPFEKSVCLTCRRCMTRRRIEGVEYGYCWRLQIVDFMKRSLLIIGAGIYALLACEIARDMGQFEKIGFIDDYKTIAPTGEIIAGKTGDLRTLSAMYTDAIVAIGNPDVRLRLIDQIKRETPLDIATLVSSKAYVAPSATLDEGVIVEPFAVVHTGCRIDRGCLISAGAVVNHESVCEEGVHIDCNATVPGYVTVYAKMKVMCGSVYKI